MTWTMKIRTLPGAPMMAEYECPEHGRFERLVERDDKGDPPASKWCHWCDDNNDVDCDDPCCTGRHCGAAAPHVISASAIQYWSRPPVPIGYASKSDEKDPRALDTEGLATGKLTRKEWDKMQRGVTLERRYQKRLKAGKISKRVQVGGGR